MICCNENRSTPFCPICGSVIASEYAKTLSELLKHAKNSLKASETNLARHKRRIEECEDRQKIYHSRAIERYVCVANKWHRWVDAIKEAMKK